MAKKIYADVIKNGVRVTISIPAKNENEARFKLETHPQYRGVSDIFDVSYLPPQKVFG